MKLVEKKRTGSKIAKTYVHPKTPCDRILARDQVSEETKQLLRAKREALDPMKLSAVIETKLQAIQALIEGSEEPEPKKEVGREKARVEDPPARPRSRSLRLVHRSAEIRQRPPRRLWPGLRAPAHVCHRHDQHPRRHPLRQDTRPLRVLSQGVPASAGSSSHAKKEPGSTCLEPGIYLATTYSHKTYRLTTIGAAAFHVRVRNGTGWFHRALVTRGQPCLIRTGTLEI